MTEKSLGNRIGPHVAAILAYSALAVWLTRPLVARLDSALAGSSSDALVHYWNGWWVRQALLSGRPLFHTDFIFFPEGVSLLYHNVAWLNIAPWLALQTFLDDQIAYNLVFLGSLVLGAYATFLLARRLCASTLAALLAGALYMAWPYRISQLDHPNLIGTAWIPLFFLFFIRAMGEGQRRYAVLAGVFLALVGYARWQLLIPATVMIVAYLLGTLPDWLRNRRKWSAGLLTAATALLLLAPPAWLLYQQQKATADTVDVLLREGEETVMSTDLLAYLTPPADHLLFGDVTEAAYDRYYPDRSALRRFSTYVGVAPLLLALIGLWRRWRDSLPWLLMALALSLLALGPVLRLNGRFLEGVPTLYGLTEPLFLFRLLRVPERFNIALALPVAVLVSFGVTVLLDKLQSTTLRWPGRRFALTAALAFIILFEYGSGPAPLRSPKISDFYSHLAAESGDGAVLDLPIDALKGKENMFAQTVHGRPLVHGKIARLPQDAYEFVDEHAWLRVMRQSGEMPPWLTDVSVQMNSLAEYGIEYIILHKDQIDAERLARWRRYLALQPVFEDKRIAVIRTRPEVGQEYTLLAELQPGLGPVQTLVTSECFEAGRPLEVDVAWGTQTDVSGEWPVRLTLEKPAGEVAQEWSFPPLEAWPAGTLSWGYYPLELDEKLDPGHYELLLALPDEAAAEVPSERMSVGPVELSDGPCPSELAAESEAVDALFGDEMRLLGYKVARPDPARLLVTLTWRSEQRMDTDYKVFMHVFDPASGLPLAQDDAMPRRGEYPTRFWAPGEIVVDEIAISLDGVPDGNYGIAVGVYDQFTNERLAVLSQTGRLAADGRLELPGETVIVGDAQRQ
jgi:hypothetical protein